MTFPAGLVAIAMTYGVETVFVNVVFKPGLYVSAARANTVLASAHGKPMSGEP